MNITLTKEEGQFIVDCLDLAVRQKGLQVAALAVALTARLQHAAANDESVKEQSKD